MKMHYGVGLLISNQEQTQFFVQQKDNDYPFKEWRGCLSFWGGAVEPEDNSNLQAVERELEEEIPQAVPLLQHYAKKKIGTFKITYAQPFILTVFEVRVPDYLLQEISKVNVLEGNGILMDRATIEAQKWIWETDFIFLEYILD